MSNTLLNSIVYLALLAIIAAAMYLKVLPQDVGLVILSAILTHMGVNIPSQSVAASTNQAAQPSQIASAGGNDNAASH